MNIIAQQAQTAYTASSQTLQSGRATEFEAFSRISHRLRSAAMRRNEDYPSFAAAISDNRRLWSTLAVDIARVENELSDELRARLFWLAEFTEAESKRILRGKGNVAVLIEVNAAVMRGLGAQEAAQ